jgi:hypothetical protein
MALITNTAGDSGINAIPSQTLNTTLFVTPNVPNAIFIAYITVGAGNYTGLAYPTLERAPLKYILGPDTTFRWDNTDSNDPLRVHWTWAQMEIQ